MQDILLVIDMQTDFVDGALGTAEAVRIVPAVAARIDEAIARGEQIYFTRDTHQANYLDTQEGRKLPVVHCVQGTPGWEIVPQLKDYAQGRTVVDKPSFGSTRLAELLAEANEKEPIRQVTLIGLCTDICVISNALLVKAQLPEVPILVDAACCAGVTPASHQNALAAMQACQIDIVHNDI
ncbi:MAG: cysteine hydrolase [Oscillospiraceae bacterium]|nr:cysteine hydrolase [Oscillospiraceae bacterium]